MDTDDKYLLNQDYLFAIPTQEKYLSGNNNNKWYLEGIGRHIRYTRFMCPSKGIQERWRQCRQPGQMCCSAFLPINIRSDMIVQIYTSFTVYMLFRYYTNLMKCLKPRDAFWKILSHRFDNIHTMTPGSLLSHSPLFQWISFSTEPNTRRPSVQN